MLEQVLTYLNNWFVVPDGVHSGTFIVEDGGGITLPFLQEKQYFRVVGSVFNDGLHRYGPAMELLKPETFDGAVWALAVPRQVVELSRKIDAWQKKYEDAVNSPYSSESFAGYSYTKASGGSGNGASPLTWQDVFRKDLNKYRKL